MAYHFYLGNMLLPVAPEKFTMKINNANQTYTLINEGEINVLKTPGLTDIEFDARIPNVEYAFATYKNGFQRADYFLYGKKNRNYLFSAICGLSVGMITIPILFYLYTFFTKTNYLVIDLIIYFVSVCLSFLLFGYIYKNYNFRILSVKGGILVWELVFTMFVISFFFR